MRALRLPAVTRSDAVVAIVLATAGQVAIWSGATHEGPLSVTVWTSLLLTLPIAWRRTAPIFAAVVFLVGGLTQAFLADSASSIWSLVALLLMALSLGVHVVGRRVAVFGSVYVASVWCTVLLQSNAPLGDKLFTAPILAGGPILVGIALRRQRDRAEQMSRRTVELERDRAESATAAAAAERARIAHELHDVVAHAVSLMIVQAGAAEELMANDPERARESLVAVREAGKKSLAELRRLLGVLGPDGQNSIELAPQPGLGELGALLTTMRDTGMVVELTVSNSQLELPRGLDLTAYRVIQESLTNVHKHAGPKAHVWLSLQFAQHELVVAVRDDGGTGAADWSKRSGTNVTGAVFEQRGGNGLIGMRERVKTYDGSLSAGPVSRSGWQVEVLLPVPTTTPSGTI